MKKPNINGKKILPKWSSKTIRKGSYSLGTAAVIIAIAVVGNMIVAKLPAQYRNFDFSERKLSTIGSQTEELVKNLDEDVSVYLIAESGQEDRVLTEMLNRYQGLSSHIKVETVDPVLHPGFIEKYTEEELSNNALIVVGEKRNKVIHYADLYESSMNYQTYQYQTTGFDGEGQVTSAISYVTTEELPIMYTITGHEESELSSDMTDAIEKENIEMKELNLLTEETVPEDADSVMLFNPQKDLSEEEAHKLIAYLESGGKAYIVTSYLETELPNIQKVLNNYGIGTKQGVVLEADADHYLSGNPMYLIPEIGTSSALGDLSGGGSYALLPVAQAVDIKEDKRDTVKVESLLTTSDSAYIKTDLTDTLEKEAGDETGAFDLGVAVSETTGEKETKLIYLTSANLFSPQIDDMVSGSNLKILTNGVSWMSGQIQSVSIPSKSTQLSYLTVTASSSRIWSVISIGLIPVICLLTGGKIWYKRRKR